LPRRKNERNIQIIFSDNDYRFTHKKGDCFHEVGINLHIYPHDSKRDYPKKIKAQIKGLVKKALEALDPNKEEIYKVTPDKINTEKYKITKGKDEYKKYLKLRVNHTRQSMSNNPHTIFNNSNRPSQATNNNDIPAPRNEKRIGFSSSQLN
jgi:hypothetical protein